MVNSVSEKKIFYTTLLKIAVPIALQNLIASSLNMVDTVMIGRLGETEIAAVGLANQIFFLLTLFLFGVSSGGAIFAAQFWGKRDIKNIRRILGLCLMTGCLVSVIFTLIALLLPRQTLAIFSADLLVLELGSSYLKAVGIIYVMTAITFAYASIMRSTEQARIPMYVSVIGLGINTLSNYLLIFGEFGFPMLGVRGAAIATAIARAIECGLLILITYKGKHVSAASIKEMMDVSLSFIKKFFNTTIPVILNESLWAVGVTLYTIIYARMGTDVVASINIASTIERLAMVLFFGIAHAAGVMIGNQIGGGNEDTAFGYAKKFIVMGPLIGVIIGGILATSANGFLVFFNVSQRVEEMVVKILVVYGCIMPVRIFNFINILGVLRSGGDTRFSLFLDTVGVWCIAVPLAFIGGLILGLPVHQVVILIAIEEVFKLILGLRRMLSKKWINNLVNHMDGEKVANGAEAGI